MLEHSLIDIDSLLVKKVVDVYARSIYSMDSLGMEHPTDGNLVR